MKRSIGFVILAVGSVLAVQAAPDPETIFRNPPQSAKTGVWWHWMGCNVTKEGIVKDLDWFKETGIGAATIFGMADICSPWATKIRNGPTDGLVAFTPDWWRLVRFACEEAERRGIEIGVHNCPGYTSTGGPWIPPRLAMRELVFNVTNAEAQISLAAHAAFPVQDGATGAFKKPDILSRRTDLQEIAVVEGVRVQHIPMGSFTQPNQWETFGLECDKMNPEAVAFHLDRVLEDMRKYVGDQVGRGLKFVLLDSYEAGRPSWTPNMRAEFKARRGYDPLPYLPILGGFKVSVAKDKAAEKKFRADYDRTIKDLYRDVLFKIMHEKLAAAGLEFACEPYTGPFDSRACAAHVDRLMTEFWYRPQLDRKIPGALGWNQWIGPGGRRHNVIEAEAFTSGPPSCSWDETPNLLKAAADTQFDRGVNRMTLHTCPLQPWGDDVLPGKVMGRWGTHFGRTQTWATSGKGWFTYLNRCQALLQWGEPSSAKIDGLNITPRGTPLTARARAADGNLVFFVVNHSNHPASMNMRLPDIGKAAEWFDPVTGCIAPLAVVDRCAAIQLAPCGSGFLVLRKPVGSLAPNADSAYYQKLAKPFKDGGTDNAYRLAGPWRVTFGGKTVEMTTLCDWTVHADPDVKYFSGTAVYRTSFTVGRRLSAAEPRILSLGNCNGQIAKVILNGKAFEPVWCEPYEVRLAAGDLKDGENTLEIEFTNVWANRLVGDEREPPDCTFVKAPYPGGWYLEEFPNWFKKGMSARPSKGRRCFTDWNYFTKDSKLTPSGLLGPVTLRVGQVIGAYETDAMKPFPVLRPVPERLADARRGFQSAPSITASPKGRLWVAWHTGDTTEGDENGLVVVSSGDGGDTWTPPLFAIDPPGPLRILDPGLWTDPDGKVWLFYAQLYGMWDGRAGVWAMHPLDPEDANTAWTPARRLCHGYMKNKPTVTRDGTWLLPSEFMYGKPFGGRLGALKSIPAEFAFDMPEYRAANVFASRDKGRTVAFLGQAQVPPKDRDFSENMVVERGDGTLWMLVRVKNGIAEAFSSDGGKTWSELRPSAILNPNSRFFIGRLKSGALLLVKNGPVGKKTGRSHITAFVSDDDGVTWLGGLVLDERNNVSYPDAVEGPDGFIHVVHDRERTKAREILHHRFTEADVRAGRLVTSGSRLKGLVNKAGPMEHTSERNR